MRWVLSAGVAIVALVSACGDDSSSPTPTPSGTANATTSAASPLTASASPTPNPNLITRGPDIDFPDDTAMIIENGCWGCEGGPSDLVRMYKDPSGSVRSEFLLSAVQSGLPRVTYNSPSGEAYDFPAPISGSAMTQDASVIAVSFCIKGSCEFSGLGDFKADSVGVAFRSLDGGITWQEVGRGGPVFRVDAVLADGRVLVGHGSQDDGVVDYALLPDNTPVQAPSDGAYPVTSWNEIFWGMNDGRLLRADGTVFLNPLTPDIYTYYRSVTGSLDDSGKGSALVFWEIPMPGTGARPDGYIDRWAIAELGPVGGQTEIVRQWEIDGYLWTIGAWSPKDDRAIISFYPEDSDHQSPVPAIVNLDTREYNLIAAPFKSEHPGMSSLGRTAVRAIQTGPFARVTGTGSCLNIRTDPSLTAAVLTCAADGVLLRDTGQTNGDWVVVMTPGRVPGWASLSFLER